MSVGADDIRFMRRAMRLAERGRGNTKPNPVVGALIVKNGQVLATGFHKRAGGPHAEIDALAKLDMRAEGATLYVTLEPCCHRGRTGPCTESILGSGIRRVVVGCCDENPLVSGRGIAVLRKAGIAVDAGCLKDECRAQNRAFFTWIRAKRPWVTMKVAATLDGCIGDGHEKSRKGKQRWITGEPARASAHALRAASDAVLVGVDTALADDPRLTVRLERAPGKTAPDPLRVVLDSHLRTPTRAALLRVAGARPPLVVGVANRKNSRSMLAKQRALVAAGAEVVLVQADRNGHVSLPALLRLLGEREVQSLLVEGGGRIHGAFVDAGLVDSVAIFLAPRLVGAGARIVEGRGLDWRKPATLGPLSVQALGDDILITADVIDRGERRRR